MGYRQGIDGHLEANISDKYSCRSINTCYTRIFIKTGVLKINVFFGECVTLILTYDPTTLDSRFHSKMNMYISHECFQR